MEQEHRASVSTRPAAREPGVRPERFISVARAAEIAGRNHDTIRRWIRNGDLRATKAGRDYRIFEADLLTMLGQLDSDEQPPSAGGAFHLRWGPLTRFELRDG